MKGRVEIRAGVRDHVDPADVKLSAGRVTRVRIFPPQMIADHRRGQTLVSNHSVFDAVTNVDQFKVTRHRFLLLRLVSAPALENLTPCHPARSSRGHRSSNATYPPGFRSALISSPTRPTNRHSTETCPVAQTRPPQNPNAHLCASLASNSRCS